MKLWNVQVALFALALLAAPAGLRAQEAPQAQAVPQEVQAWVAELQQIHARLESLQRQALEDPALNQAQEELGESIKAEMARVDPTLDQGMERIEELEAAAAAAQQSGDRQTLQQLGAEAQQIQARFMEAQQQALRQPALAQQLEAFQEDLEARMLQIDPEAERLIARFRELEGKLEAAMQGAAPDAR